VFETITGEPAHATRPGRWNGIAIGNKDHGLRINPALIIERQAGELVNGEITMGRARKERRAISEKCWSGSIFPS
jgi:hypothetical protein